LFNAREGIALVVLSLIIPTVFTDEKGNVSAIQIQNLHAIRTRLKMPALIENV